MINFSVSRPLRALTFRAGEKTAVCSQFLPNFGSVEAVSRNSRPLFKFPRRREENVTKNAFFSLFLFFSLSHSQDVWIYNTDSKNQQKIVPSFENEGLDCMTLCWYLGVRFFFFLLFSHARIDLLIEPGRETEKLIIVPLKVKDTIWKIILWISSHTSSVTSTNFSSFSLCKTISAMQY